MSAIHNVDWLDPATFISCHSHDLPLASFFAGKTWSILKTLKMNGVIMQDERWRDLCWEAMHEKDVNKLLTIFLELDRATEGKQLMEVFTETYESTGKSKRKKTGQTDQESAKRSTKRWASTALNSSPS
jgi:hypothetical protein